MPSKRTRRPKPKARAARSSRARRAPAKRTGAGGFLGAVVAWPLSRAVATYGAVVVCLGLVALGALVFTATPIASVGRGLRRMVLGRPATDAAGTDGRPPLRDIDRATTMPDV